MHGYLMDGTWNRDSGCWFRVSGPLRAATRSGLVTGPRGQLTNNKAHTITRYDGMIMGWSTWTSGGGPPVTCNAGQVREERGGASSDSLIITRFQVGILKQRIPSTKRLWEFTHIIVLIVRRINLATRMSNDSIVVGSYGQEIRFDCVFLSV